MRLLRRRLLALAVPLVACAGAPTPAPVTSPASAAEAAAPVPVEPAPSPAPTPAPAPEPPVPPERALDVASFDQVWTTIRDRHYDPTLGGLDWNAVRAELRPRVIAARDRAEVRAILTDLIGRLKLSHFGVMPGDEDAAGDQPPVDEGDVGGVGLDVRPLGGAMVVTAVAPGGPAAKAGVKPGWELVAIAGKPVAELLAPVRAAQASSSLLASEETGAVLGELIGPRDQVVEVRFVPAPGQRPVTRPLTRAALPGTIARFGHLPPIPVEYASRRLGPRGGFGYIHLSVFFDPARVTAAWQQDIAAFADARGLVLDLRGNPGGIGAMAMGMSGWLVTEVATLGTMKTRETETRFVVNPQPGAYTGPLAILVDELSASTSEILAAGLQDLGRARVFGRRTPGAALPSQFVALPNGDRFQFAVATYVSSGGRTLEGQGVVPDEVVPLDRKRLLAGKDPDLDAALRWLTAQAATPATKDQP